MPTDVEHRVKLVLCGDHRQVRIWLFICFLLFSNP
jgi:hypothetical protein